MNECKIMHISSLRNEYSHHTSKVWHDNECSTGMNSIVVVLTHLIFFRHTNIINTMMPQVALALHGLRVFDVILIYNYSLRRFSHVPPHVHWASPRSSVFLQTPKNMTIGGLAMLYCPKV